MHNRYEYEIRVKFWPGLGVEVATAEPFFCELLTVCPTGLGLGRYLTTSSFTF